MVKKSPLEPSAGRRKRAYELPNLINIQVPQDPIRQIEREALADLSNEYRQLRIESMIQAKRKQLSSNEPSSNIQVQKANLELIKAAMDMAKSNQPKDQPDKTLEYLRFFNELMKTNQGASMQPSFFDQYIKGRELGIFGQPSTGDSNPSDVQIEKLRGERMLTGKKLDLEIQKIRLEAELDRDKLSMIVGVLGPIAAYGGNQMAQKMAQMGMDSVNRYRGQGNPSPEVEGLKELSGETAKMEISCPCGFSEALLVPVPPPAVISCPGCGKKLGTAALPSEASAYGEQWMQKT